MAAVSAKTKPADALWSRKLAKSSIYPTSLTDINQRIAALQPLWQHAYAGVLPVARASCSPLYLCVDVDEAVAATQLGGTRERYKPFASFPVSEEVAAAVVGATAQTLARLHACGVVHGHVHLGALLHHDTDTQQVVLLEAELPMSAIVPSGALGQEARRCAAPEILRGDPYAAAADVWGLGVLLLQLLSRAVQGAAASSPTTTSDIVDSDLLSPFLSALSPRAASFVLPCLKSDPLARPLLWDLLQHPFLASDAAGTTDSAARDSDDSSSSSSNGSSGGDEESGRESA